MVSWLPFKHLKAWKYRNTTFSSQFDDSWYFLDNNVVSSLLIIIFLLLKYEFLKIIMLTFIWFFFKPHSVSFLNRRLPIFLFYKSSIFSCTWMKNRKWYGLHDTYVTLRKLCFNSFIWINKYILLCFQKNCWTLLKCNVTNANQS